MYLGISTRLFTGLGHVQARTRVTDVSTKYKFQLYLNVRIYCSKLKHNRVAQLFGVVSNMPYYCVLELPVNGDLKTFLLTTKNINTQ